MRQQTGKRPRQHREYEREEKKDQHKRPFPNAHESSNNDGLVLYRILCPDSLIGSVIGKNGNVINAIRQQTSAKVMVVDPYPGADKRVILVYCYVKHRDLDAVGNDNEPVCAAQDALLRVHNAIVDALHKVHKNRRDSDNKDTEEANILVPASQTSNIIGKSGAVIKHLRSTSRAFVKVTPKDPSDATHSCAMSFDNFVQITGGAEAVKKALFGVSTIIYKHPSKEGIPLETSIPEPTPSIIIPSELPVYPARELEFRVLCPGDKIGLVIGRGGATIKNIRQESGARIDVDDAKNGKEESIITITSTEVINDVKSAAVEAVLLLQAKINDYEDDRMNLRLVPNKVIGCLIGRAGSIVNDMRKKTKANILISKGNKPWRASSSDELVEVSGEADKLRDALVQIILRLREDVLKESVESQNSDKDGKLTTAISDSLYGNNLSFPALLPQNPQIVSLGYDRRGESERALEVFPCTSSYGYSSMKDHVTDDGYGGLPSYTSKAYEEHLPRVEMTVPASGLSKVMGKHGTNLENIRKISGAHIEIIESKSSRHEHVAYITGTSEQRQSAENLIKAFIMST
ncbi:RNA-binding KH domain-containing protein [Zea mays]|uniref:RNA-binding KH domain-containing protein n=1 Tax=Zea mays TaxID=4577 RepID=A0A1D6PUD9_MAIZE|nr:RNA-binding KH domain-containing protein [Zea mays]